jgi:Zn-dependent peptidase ImmA (M78 family)
MVRPLNPSWVLDPVEALRRLGVHVAERDLGAGGPDGIYVSADRGGVVVLNTAKPLCRLRRIAAHLLAHHVLGDEPHLDRDIDAAPDDPVQARANAFADRFLAGARVDSLPDRRHNGPTMGQILGLR